MRSNSSTSCCWGRRLNTKAAHPAAVPGAGGFASGGSADYPLQPHRARALRAAVSPERLPALKPAGLRAPVLCVSVLPALGTTTAALAPPFLTGHLTNAR